MVVHIEAHAGPCGCYAVRALRSPNPTTSSRAHLRFALLLRTIQPLHFLQSCIFVYNWGYTPDPQCRRHLLKNQKYYGILVVAFSKGNLPNPFGVRRAPSEPASVLSVVKKIPRQILILQNTLKHHANHNFLSLISNGDSPPNYSPSYSTLEISLVK